MTSPNLTEIVTTTLRNRKKEIADNVTNKNALLRELTSRGRIRELDGGRTIVCPLDYAENSTFQWYEGYETLNTSATDTITAAEYDWKQANVNVVISGREQAQNSGTNAIINLLEARIKSAMRTMSNNISEGIYSDGTGSGGKEIGGLQLLVADSPATGTVGGISRLTNTFWRNTSYSAVTDGGATASSSNILSYMNTVFNTVARGNEKPDIIVADLNYFTFYQDSLQANQRFMSAADLAAGDFTALMYGEKTKVLLDNGSGIPTNHMYFLNTEYLSFDVHKDRFMSPRTGREPVNQDSVIIPIVFMGNLTMSNAARQGVLKA